MLDYKDNYILDLLLTSSNNLTISDITKLLGIAQNAEFIIEVNGENESSKMDELKGILVENKIV